MLASLDPQASLYPRPRPAHYGPRLDSRHAHHHPRPNLERWGRSSSVPERWPPEPEPDWTELTSGSGLLGASHGRSASSHNGGSYLLRQRSNPLGGRLGRQYSISSDYVADTSLYDPNYSYPSFHGISDSLRDTRSAVVREAAVTIAFIAQQHQYQVGRLTLVWRIFCQFIYRHKVSENLEIAPEYNEACCEVSGEPSQ